MATPYVGMTKVFMGFSELQSAIKTYSNDFSKLNIGYLDLCSSLDLIKIRSISISVVGDVSLI